MCIRDRDKGPTSHAVKPKEYVAIDNFYTTTIYEKGAELIRMLELLLGKENFFKGINLYIKTFDGSAATTEDFINSLIKGAYLDKANCTFNLTKFLNWYYERGTPKVYVNQSWDSKNSILNVSFEQKIDDNEDFNFTNIFADCNWKQTVIICCYHSILCAEVSRSICFDTCNTFTFTSVCYI